MSQIKDARKVASVNMKLKKVVDWKIFELQSILVSEDVDDDAVNESLQWFQPRHFSEVVEERINDDRCGYPLCLNPLDDHSNAAYRINYAEKKIYSIELSSRYCCVACIEKAQLLEKRFDDSVPYSRSVIKTLDLTAPMDTNIDEVLNLLTPHPVQSKASASSGDAHDSDLPVPPVYSSSILSDAGGLPVTFVDGLPVPVVPEQIHTGDRASTAQQQQQQQRDLAQSQSAGDDRSYHHDMDVDADAEAAPAVVPAGVASSALHREVYHSREHAAESEQTAAPPSELTAEERSKAATTANTATSTTKSVAATDSTKADVSMAEMFATMNALRVKHNLSNPSTTPTVPGATRFTNGTLLEKKPTPVKKDIVTSPTATGSTVRSGTMGRRPGPKNVRWGANSSTSIDNTASVESMTSSTSVVAAAAAPAGGEALPASLATASSPILKSTAAAPAAVPVVKEAAPISGAKRTTMQLSGQVMERVNPRPMSAAAMMRKREDVESPGGSKIARNMLGSASSGAILSRTPEPATTSSLAAASAAEEGQGLGTYDRDEMDRGDDEGEQWVDVDPAELLALGYSGPGAGAGGGADVDSAMSIEGYIANVKKSIRVSPATTIKNLSHSPYTYHDINHLVNAANSERGEEEPMDEAAEADEGQMSVDGDGDEDENEVATQNTDDEDGAWETEDEGEGADEAGGQPEPAPTQSLFLTVWATMDELFGASLDSVFQVQESSDVPAGAIPAAQPEAKAAQLVRSPPEAFPEPAVDTIRPPIALEQQNAQHAFVKLLQRGIQSAEAQLSLTSLVLTLHEERSAYAVIKHKLLNTANNTLQKRNNLSSALGSSNAGTGLHSAGWTLIGLLVIDAFVTKRQIGPLRRKQAARQDPSAAAGTLAARDVSAEAWNGMIERTAAEVLYSATSRKNSNVGKLRDGDLQILRSYFDYL